LLEGLGPLPGGGGSFAVGGCTWRAVCSTCGSAHTEGSWGRPRVVARRELQPAKSCGRAKAYGRTRPSTGCGRTWPGTGCSWAEAAAGHMFSFLVGTFLPEEADWPTCSRDSGWTVAKEGRDASFGRCCTHSNFVFICAVHRGMNFPFCEYFGTMRAWELSFRDAVQRQSNLPIRPPPQCARGRSEASARRMGERSWLFFSLAFRSWWCVLFCFWAFVLSAVGPC